MGKEQPPEYYNGIKYMKPEVFKRYEPVYNAAASLLPSNGCPRIVDLGCGTGHFARIIRKKGYWWYLGIDFSPQMIEKARGQVPKGNFVQGDLLSLATQELYEKDNLFVLLEVLEHIEEDFRVLENIPSDSQVIFSMPSFNATSHVRHFKEEVEIKKRYKKYLKFKESVIIPWGKNNKIFLFDCVKR